MFRGRLKNKRGGSTPAKLQFGREQFPPKIAPSRAREIVGASFFLAANNFDRVVVRETEKKQKGEIVL
jgi:hypothetical protein